MPVDPYGRRQPGQRGSRGTPQNTRLWSMLQMQARQRFRQYPSIPASKWVHDEYVKRGGIFVESKKQDDEHRGRGREDKKKPPPKKHKKGRGKK